MGTKLRAPGSAIASSIARLVLAVQLLYFSITDADGFGFAPETDDGWALTYLVIAGVLGFVAWRSWWWDFRLRTVAFSADVAMVMIVEHIEPVHYGFFTTGVSIATFALLSTALRFGEKATIRAAVALNVVGGVICISRNLPVLYPVMHKSGEIDFFMDVRHIIFHAVISGLAVWLARQLNPVPQLTRFDFDGSQGGTFDAALAYALRVTGAAEGILCWRAMGESEAQLFIGDAKGWSDLARNVPGTMLAIGEVAEPVLFAQRLRDCLKLGQDGEIAIGRRDFAADGLIVRSGYSEGLSIPVPCASGLAWIVLSGLPPIGTDALRASPAIAAEIGAGIDRGQFEKISRASAMSTLRNTIARDLHDSVAQSLAGAGYWLQSLQLKKGIPDEVRRDIARTKDALDKENSGIREIIDRLRDDIEIGGRLYLDDQLREVIATLGKQWRLDIKLKCPSVPLIVTAATAHDIQQILREALANAVRHGRATSVAIAIVRLDGRVTVSIEDNGSGFAAVPVLDVPRTLAERTIALGGFIEVGNGNEGALIIIDLPEELFE